MNVIEAKLTSVTKCSVKPDFSYWLYSTILMVLASICIMNFEKRCHEEKIKTHLMQSLKPVEFSAFLMAYLLQVAKYSAYTSFFTATLPGTHS